jgi:hypothetical protein
MLERPPFTTCAFEPGDGITSAWWRR